MARHNAEISRNTFAFEDMIGLGDNDLDDMIVQINYFTLKQEVSIILSPCSISR